MTENILNLLAYNAQNHPKKTAITYDGRNISFSDLFTASRTAGAHISKLCPKGSAVGVIAERTPATLIFFFGVLFAGCFYVPLDPEYPAHKFESITADAEITVILGNEKYKETVINHGFTGSYLSEECLTSEGAVCECDIPCIDEDTPLYLIYTSGSTGTPKGVLKSHKSMRSFIDAYAETFDFSQDDVIGNQTPFFFDASAKDIYLMLKTGMCLNIIPQHLFAVPLDLITYLNEQKITFISWVPTALSIPARVNAFSVIKPKTLKKVFFVGEVMPVKYLKKWYDAMPDITYVNLYGSSEIAGVCTYCAVNATMLEHAVLPLGQPLPNCRVFPVNDGHVVTTPGEIGELYIVSDALASEYYHDPDRTEEKFVMTDLCSPGKKERVFKTGDLAYLDEQGNLFFSSRADFQIKHMGRRIELGEIESVADTLPEISRNVCLYNEARKQIVLFAELSEGAMISEAEIREALKGKLSDYMLPGKVVILDRLPLSPNGKLDRPALKNRL